MPNRGQASSGVVINVYKKLGIPNTFTPNNDGINDTWDITNLTTYPQTRSLYLTGMASRFIKVLATQNPGTAHLISRFYR
jgi:hypothetical protein